MALARKIKSGWANVKKSGRRVSGKRVRIAEDLPGSKGKKLELQDTVLEEPDSRGEAAKAVELQGTETLAPQTREAILAAYQSSQSILGRESTSDTTSRRGTPVVKGGLTAPTPGSLPTPEDTIKQSSQSSIIATHIPDNVKETFSNNAGLAKSPEMDTFHEAQETVDTGEYEGDNDDGVAEMEANISRVWKGKEVEGSPPRYGSVKIRGGGETRFDRRRSTTLPLDHKRGKRRMSGEELAMGSMEFNCRAMAMGTRGRALDQIGETLLQERPRRAPTPTRFMDCKRYEWQKGQVYPLPKKSSARRGVVSPDLFTRDPATPHPAQRKHDALPHKTAYWGACEPPKDWQHSQLTMDTVKFDHPRIENPTETALSGSQADTELLPSSSTETLKKVEADAPEHVFEEEYSSVFSIMSTLMDDVNLSSGSSLLYAGCESTDQPRLGKSLSLRPVPKGDRPPLHIYNSMRQKEPPERIISLRGGGSGNGMGLGLGLGLGKSGQKLASSSDVTTAHFPQSDKSVPRQTDVSTVQAKDCAEAEQEGQKPEDNRVDEDGRSSLYSQVSQVHHGDVPESAAVEVAAGSVNGSFSCQGSSTSSVAKMVLMEYTSRKLRKISHSHRSLRQTIQDAAASTMSSLSERGFSLGRKKKFQRKPIPF